MVRLTAPLLALLLAGAARADPAAAPAPPPPPGAVEGRFLFPGKTVWAGEVFDLKLGWRVDWDLFRALDGDTVWAADPLVAEPWVRATPGKPAPDGGRTLATLTLTTRAMALQPGRIRLVPARQTMQIVTGGYETDGVKIATIGPVMAQSAAATLTVRPLPPAPAGFTGAVGTFRLTSSLDGKAAEAGKPLVWTLTLSGTGNWSGFAGVPARQLPRAFDLVGTPTQSEDKGGSLFERAVTERITIVPRAAGHFTLEPVTMSVFDAAAGRYTTITAPAIPLDVAPGPAGAQPPAYEAEPDPEPLGEPLPPALAGTGKAWAPLPTGLWHGLLALPAVALGLLWLALAWRRARDADPERMARRARAGLIRTLAALAAEPAVAERRRLVRGWQRDAGALLRIDHAAPPTLGEPAWARLWDEAERFLYGRAVPLPADWPARAAAALADRAAPARFDPRTIFAPRNLYPVAAIMCAFVAASAVPLPATDSASLRQRIEAAPRDWIAHYDLARDAAGNRRWGEAAAQAGIAWVQQPRSAETRALWTRAAREAGFGGRAAGGLPLPDDAGGKLSGLLPPLGWQAATLAMLVLAGAGLAALLLRRFGRAPRRIALPAATAAAVGLAGLVIGLAGLGGYGPAGAADAAIVWRQVPLRGLPVDTPDDEAPVTLAPGTAGHVGRRFMGWARLTLADGRSGWLRRDELLPLWRPRP